MKRKVISTLLCLAMTVTMLAGCGGKGDEASGSTTANATEAKSEGASETDAAAEGETQATEKAEVVSTVGDAKGTHFNMWTFVEMHSNFYAGMVEQWNTENPDKPIEVTFTTYPYDDMHNKLTLALQSGEGAPDLCDIEIGKFPNYLQGEVQFKEMNAAIEPYQKDIVQARIDIYGKDGKFYGVPTHVGATVMYYNTKILDQYGIDYTKIKTWDDYTEAGKKLYEASNGEVTMTSVDTKGTDWLWLSMAENEQDWTDAEGNADVTIESVNKMLTMQQGWLTDNVAMISPGGQTDVDEGFANIGDGNIASFPKAMWYMSRFLTYMPEMTDTWAIAPCPVYTEGENRSVGIGGTGTVVTNQCENGDLAAEFIAWAKLSEEGEKKIWEDLGFDTCNTSIWTDEKITKDETNKYIAYFKTNPFDTLNEIKDEIGKVNVVTISPTINDILCNITLNAIFEDGQDVTEALQEAQDAIELEQ